MSDIFAFLYFSGSLIFPIVYTFKKMTYYVNKADDEVIKPPLPVSIVIPAFNEEAFIAKTLTSLQSQNVVLAHPEMFEVIVADNESTDRTIDVAREYTRHVISAPKGKLNARHAGIMYAHNPIIASADADVTYPVNYFNLMLQHYYKKGVVGVYGPFVNIHGDQPMISLSAMIGISGYLQPPLGRFWASNSSFLRQAYINCGGLNLDVDQSNRWMLNREEEVKFYHRLKTQGRIIYDVRLGVMHTGRYEFCLAPGFLKRCDATNPICQYCLDILAGERFK